MPTHPSMARRSSRAHRSITEWGSQDHMALKASGIFETTSVQDRIRQWQVHGAASAIPPDALSVLSMPRSDNSIISRPASRDEDDDLLLSAGSESRSHTPQLARATKSSRVRSASTPRKRVVSDEHWRAKRSPKQKTHANILENGDKENIGPDSTSPKVREQKSIKKPRSEREERRQRRVEARSQRLEKDKKHGPDELHDRNGLNTPDRTSIEISDLHARGKRSDNKSGYQHVSSTIDDQPPSEFGDNVGDMASNGPHIKSKYAEVLGQSPPPHEDIQLKSKKGSFLNRTKEVLGITDMAPVISNRLPSIEAWLDDQPDPFVEDSPLKVRFEDEVSPPVKPHLKSRRPEKENRLEKENRPIRDPNQIWDTIRDDIVIDHLTSEQSDVGDSVLAQNKEIQASSPINLKRRGAKTARPKRHTLPHIPHGIQNLQNLDNHDDQPLIDSKSRGQRVCPSTGPTRLSTIASVETLQTGLPIHEEPAESSNLDVKGNFTTHEDMMTVLSRPSLRKSTKRKRSVRVTDNQQDSDPVKQILELLAEDETKYNRELRTLVDGVIPVLLQCVLSRSDAVAAAEFFTTSGDSVSFSRPIIDMGIALERLKSLHNRIPLRNLDALLAWCQTAHKAYSEYLKAWRLGFQDVVVNLAPIDGSDSGTNEVMERNESGDIINSEGETVDIAYLMKRPLVNIRKLGRALSDIHEEMPNHPIAGKIAEDYRELTAAAKTKHQQEKGRLEDEAAANIDSTKCRDIRNMGPLPGAVIEKNKRVRARDCFSMTLFHSTGQRMDCKIELILRDNQHDAPDGGDMLICQIEEAGKWLLFSPVDLSTVSARKGESGCDLVIMVRGRAGLGKEWHELLALQADEPEAVSEWMIMLGSNPLPPKLSRLPSFVDHKVQKSVPVEPEIVELTASVLERVSSVETIDVPIGEPSILGIVTVKEDVKEPSKAAGKLTADKPTVSFSLGGGLQRKPMPEHWQNQYHIARKPVAQSILSSNKSTISGRSNVSVSTYTPSSMVPMDQAHSQAKHAVPSHTPEMETEPSRYRSQSARLPEKVPFIPTDVQVTEISKRPEKQHKSLQPLSGSPKTREGKHESTPGSMENTPDRKKPLRTLSSTQNEASSSAQKSRDSPSTNIPLTDAIRETWSTLSGFGRKPISQPTTPIAKVEPQQEESADSVVLPKRQTPRNSLHIPAKTGFRDLPQPIPQYKPEPLPSPHSGNGPILGPSEAQLKLDRQNGKISHSPLRKQYRPSSASASEESDSDPSSSSDDDSQTSEEPHPELYGRSFPKPYDNLKHRPQVPVPPPHSTPTTGTRTLAPSDSASQGPYRRVPSSAERPDVVTKRAVAMICSWNDAGTWEPLIDEYCSIIISPGLMEAFPMSEAHSGSPNQNRQPLAAFELTPIVPLRRPTGLDINIRSPPTPNSRIQTSSNIMFRSHSAAECEAFYHMINWARCHNPTYLELQRSRPKVQPAVTFSDQQAPRPRSWFSFGGGIRRRNSYRVGNIPPSSMGESQMTANTTSSAMSALRRLTQSSSFNVNRSSVRRRSFFGASGSQYSSSNGTGLDSGKNTPPPSQLGMIPGKDGPNVPPTSAAAVNGGGMVHNMKIRLQIRQDSGWVTLGLSRLTILPAVKRSYDSLEQARPASAGSLSGGGDESSRRASTVNGVPEIQERHLRLPSSNYTPHRLHGGGREKRVVVTLDKDPSRVLLDATLGESCFEKISHLGIALQVWRSADEIRSRGGVGLGQNTKYLFQFFHAKECAWVFELVGRYRYSAITTE